MTSLTRCTWIWVDSGSWWWTGRPGVLRFMGSQGIRHDWVTKLTWTDTESATWALEYSLTRKKIFSANEITLSSPAASGAERIYYSFWLLSKTSFPILERILQYSCLKNSMDRGAWRALVHRVTMTWTWLKWLCMHTQYAWHIQDIVCVCVCVCVGVCVCVCVCLYERKEGRKEFLSDKLGT